MIVRAPKNYYFLVPIAAGVAWGGMLIAMLAAWSFQGHPIYYFIGRYQEPVYISHIGATNLKPLFISCAAFQGLFYCLTLITEYWLRKKGKLQYWFKKSERNLLFAGCILGVVGQLGILFCSIFDTKNYNKAHYSFLALFVVCLFLSLCLLVCQYWLMAVHYQQIHVSHKFWNKFRISATIKVIWTAIASALVLLFVCVSNKSVSGWFEWTLAFWYLALFLIMAWDLSSAAKHKHKNYPHIEDWNDKGFYLYDKHFGDSRLTNSSELEGDILTDNTFNEEGDYRKVERDFTEDELRQYPLDTSEDVYPIPDGQRVPIMEANV